MTNRPDLNAIEARANAATEGPWEVRYVEVHGKRYGLDGVFLSDGRLREMSGSGGAMSCTPRVAAFPGADDDEKLAEFIAHARQDVPALIARVRELEGALQKIADLPLDDDVSVRRRRIALRALGATAQAVQKVADQVHTYIAAQAPGKDR